MRNWSKPAIVLDHGHIMQYQYSIPEKNHLIAKKNDMKVNSLIPSNPRLEVNLSLVGDMVKREGQLQNTRH